MMEEAEAAAPTAQVERPRRTRRFKKRVRFQVPKPILPVKALWESASEEERARAHRTCGLMIEYWLGHKTKAEMVSLLDLPPLRVWQLSQSALSGMLAGLLKQPRKGKKGADPMGSKTSEMAELRKENAKLKKELERTKLVLELLKDLPFNRGAAGSMSASLDESPAVKKKRRSRARPSGSEDLGSPAA